MARGHSGARCPGGTVPQQTSGAGSWHRRADEDGFQCILPLSTASAAAPRPTPPSHLGIGHSGGGAGLGARTGSAGGRSGADSWLDDGPVPGPGGPTRTRAARGSRHRLGTPHALLDVFGRLTSSYRRGGKGSTYHTGAFSVCLPLPRFRWRAADSQPTTATTSSTWWMTTTQSWISSTMLTTGMRIDRTSHPWRRQNHSEISKLTKNAPMGLPAGAESPGTL